MARNAGSEESETADCRRRHLDWFEIHTNVQEGEPRGFKCGAICE